MSRKKKRKFDELKGFQNVFEWKDQDFKDLVKGIFNESNAVILELACGKGDYAVYLGKRYPKKLVVGIDIQGERIWSGAKRAMDEDLDNVLFLRLQIENLSSVIPKGSVNEIWITFPDPFPRDRDSKRRLTSPRFLRMYKKLLKSGGSIHLKTDSEDLYEYTLDIVKEEGFRVEVEVEDVYLEGLSVESEVNEVQTTFEKKHLEEGKTIRYLRVSL